MKPADSQPNNLFLIGFMGTGKSSIGRDVARSLGIPFLDSDKAIEQEVGQTVSEIFNQFGEKHFRNLERQFIETLQPHQNCVIACGGGLPIAPGMLDLLNQKGHTVALFANATTVFNRTNHRAHRPLLQGSDLEKQQIIENLLKEREPIYQKAHMAIRTDGSSIEETASRIIRWYQQRVASNCL